MKLGTKSLLYGTHQFILHPLLIARAWWYLYGFPWNPALWVAFIVHDWGYWGKPNMDGPEGKDHPILGANIMHYWFDTKNSTDWFEFTITHSRYWANLMGCKPSQLCFADKLVPYFTPRWLYLLQARLTGELYEYMEDSKDVFPSHDPIIWYENFVNYMKQWVEKNV